MTICPEKWKWVRLRDIGTILNGATPKTNVAEYWSPAAVLLPKNSVVYSSRAPIGHIAITKKELATNQGCKSIASNFEIVLSDMSIIALLL